MTARPRIVLAVVAAGTAGVLATFLLIEQGDPTMSLDPWVLVAIAAIVAVIVLAIVRSRWPDALREALTVVLGIWCATTLLGLTWAVVSLLSVNPPADDGTRVAVHWLGTTRTWKNASPVAANAVFMLTAGALGGAIHVARSFAAQTGLVTFRARWAWWHLLNPLIGGVAGLVVTLGVQGQVLASGAEAGVETQNALAAFLAFVAGLFSRSALERLERFLPRPTTARGEPRITNVEPDHIDPTVATPKLTITGSGLRADTTVRIGAVEATKVTLEKGALVAEFGSPLAAGDNFLVVENENTHRDVALVSGE
ncbi:MAG TPA: hypothetical protein VK507_00430 [Iamia sp.]|nr:hypothetical protein [Iamia sp.]